MTVDVNKTYSEEDLTKAVSTAVDAAVAPYKSELETLKASLAENDFEARIEAIKAEAAEQLAVVQAELDGAMVAKAAVESAVAERDAEITAIKEYLAGEVAAAQAAADAEARKGAVVEAVKEFGLKEDFIEARLESWSAMDDEAFSELVETLRVVASAEVIPSTDGTDSKIPVSTAMAGTRPAPSAKTSAISDMFAVKRAGVDPRTS